MIDQHDNLYEKYDKQVADSVNALYELTSRIDERVKNMTENQKRIENKFDLISENQQQLLQRVTALESKNGHELKKIIDEVNERLRKVEIKIESLDFISKGMQSKLDKSLDYVMKFSITVAAAILIFKLTGK